MTSNVGETETGTFSEPQFLVPGPAVGLVNLGNTCFFNSAIQLLLACPQLNEAARPARVQAGTQPGPVAGAGGESPFVVTQQVLGRGPLGFALQQALLNVNGPKHSAMASVSSQSHGHHSHPHGSKGAYNPQALLAAVCRIAPRFKGRQQHDSHELMRLLLDGLQEEENRAAGLNRRRPSKEASPPSSPASPHPSAAAMVADAGNIVGGGDTGGANDSVIARLFGGQLVSCIRCGTCGHTAMSPECFYDLSLPIPDDLPELDKREVKGLAAGTAVATAGDEQAGTEAVGAPAGKGKKVSMREKRELEKKEKKAASRAAAQNGGKEASSTVKGKGTEKRKGKGRQAELGPELVAQADPGAEVKAPAADLLQRQRAKTGKGKSGAAGSINNCAVGRAKSMDGEEAAAATPAPAGKECKKLSHKQLRKLEREQRKVSIAARRQAKKTGQANVGAEEDVESGTEGAESGLDEAAHKILSDGEGDKPEAKQVDTAGAEAAEPTVPTAASAELANAAEPSHTAMRTEPADGVQPKSSPGATAAAANTVLAKCRPGNAPDAKDELGTADSEFGVPPSTRNAMRTKEAAEMASSVSEGSGACASPTRALPQERELQVEPESVRAFLQSQLQERGSSKPCHHELLHQGSVPPAQRPAPLCPLFPRVLDVGACLAAFFASETVSWECPRERAEAASPAPSAVGSLVVTPMTVMLRKQVSWSPSAPEVFLVPGSAEQRGTNLEEAMRGNAPFFRPAKALGSSFIVQAQLDPFDTETMHVQLQPFAGSTSSAAMLASAAATNSSSSPAAATGTSPISTVAMSPVLSTILGSSPRGSPRGGAGTMLPPSTRNQQTSLGQGGVCSKKTTVLDQGPFSERGLPLACLDVSLAWHCGDSPREQSRWVQAAAQLVMDCVADLMAAPGGLQHMMDMLGGGLELLEAPASQPSSSRGGLGKMRFLLRGKYKASHVLLGAPPRGSVPQTPRVTSAAANGDGDDDDDDDDDDDGVNGAQNVDNRNQPAEAIPIARGISNRGTTRCRTSSSSSSSNMETWDYPTVLRRSAEHPAFAHVVMRSRSQATPTASSSSLSLSSPSSSSSSPSCSSPGMSHGNSETETDREKDADGLRRRRQPHSLPLVTRQGAVSRAEAAVMAASAAPPANATAATPQEAEQSDVQPTSNGMDAAGALSLFANGRHNAGVAGLCPNLDTDPDLVDSGTGEHTGAGASLHDIQGVNLDPALHPHHHHHHHHHHNHPLEHRLRNHGNHRHHDHLGSGGPQEALAGRDGDSVIAVRTAALNGTTASALDGDGLFDMDDLSSPSALASVSGQDQPSTPHKLSSPPEAILSLLSPPPLDQSPFAPVVGQLTGATSPTRAGATIPVAKTHVESVGAAAMAPLRTAMARSSTIAAAIPTAATASAGAFTMVSGPASPSTGTVVAASDTAPIILTGTSPAISGADEHGKSEDRSRMPPLQLHFVPADDSGLRTGFGSGSGSGPVFVPAFDSDSGAPGAPRGAENEPAAGAGNAPQEATALGGAAPAISDPIKIPSPSSPFCTLPAARAAEASDSGEVSADVGGPMPLSSMSAGMLSMTASTAATAAADRMPNGPLQRSSSGGLRRSSGGNFQRSSSKQYYLRHAPEVLVLHLKRFAMDARGRLTKIGKHVGFDTALDLGPFITDAAAAVAAAAMNPVPASPSEKNEVKDKSLGDEISPRLHKITESGEEPGTPFQGQPSGREQLTLAGQPQQPAADPHRSQPQQQLQQPRSALTAAVAMQSAAAQHSCLYDLLGLVEHSGEMRYGHYVAYVRRSKPGPDGAPQWYYVSDTQVRPVAEAQVLRAQAYILMYTRRREPLPQQHAVVGANTTAGPPLPIQQDEP